jgi:glycosyltransferase involved in cell wall biosynthesis
MPSPLFTVATITYNSGKWVEQTIESVLASSFTDFEFLISDDCSTDETWTIIQKYQDPRIRSWRNETNLREYPNRNKVLNEAKGRFILYIDGDDILYRDALHEYATYLRAFPEAKAVWGVYPVYFDFVAFPYLFSSQQLTSLNFLSTYPVTVVGFTDSVFSVKELKELGGFDERFAIGDTYIKRKFSCFYDVLLVPAGRAFWRQHPGQASNRVRFFYRNLIETYRIDHELLHSDYFPLKEEQLERAVFNFRIRSVKLIILNTIRKGKLIDFFRLMNTLSVPYLDILLIFKKGNYDYKAGGSSVEPLLNSYNFQST